jgi:hypothetical protein
MLVILGFQAFVAHKSLMKTGIYYFGIADDNVHLEWLKKTQVDHVAELFSDGKLGIPGFTRLRS